MNVSHLSKLKKSKIDKLIKSVPFFACLSDEELVDLESIIAEKHFSKNEVILLEEDTPNYLYIVYSGKVKAVQINIDGKEKILAIHKKGDFFGEMAILDGKTSPATVIAMEDAHIMLIAYSAPFRPPIPEHSGHLFRSIPATHSEAFRPL